jgi:hypothetical protein
MSTLRTNISLWLLVSALGILSSSGCGKPGGGLSAADPKAFDSAPPDIKQVWQQALTAEAATNYLDAVKALKSLRSMQLNEAQFVALQKEAADFNQRLFAAAEKNDPAAVEAVKFMRSQR